MRQKQNILSLGRPLVVGTVHTPAGLRRMARGPVPGADLLELRLDLLASCRRPLEQAAAAASQPILLTARCPAEGGAAGLGVAERRRLLDDFLPLAACCDVECRSVRSFAQVLERAGRLGVATVLSFHDFRGTPGLGRLREVVRRAHAAGAGVVKLATWLRGPADLAQLLLLAAENRGTPLALMGMGPLGRASRPLLAAAGSRLNYGYVDAPQVHGQWPVLALRRRIEELESNP